MQRGENKKAKCGNSVIRLVSLIYCMRASQLIWYMNLNTHVEMSRVVIDLLDDMRPGCSAMSPVKNPNLNGP